MGGESGALFHVLRAVAQSLGGVGLLPDALAAVVVSGVVVGQGLLLGALHDVAVLVGHVEAPGGGVADLRVTDGGQAVLGVQGVALRHIGLVLRYRVAAEVVLIAIDQRHEGLHIQSVLAQGGSGGHVGVDAVLRIAVAELVGVLQIGAAVEHGGVGVVAVEAEYGDGVLHAQGAVSRSAFADEEEALDVVAVDVLILAQVEGDVGRDGHSLAGGHGQAHAVEALKGDLGVVGIHVAVLVQIGVLLVVELEGFIGAPVQQVLGIHAVDHAVAVEVIVLGQASGLIGLAVHSPDDAGGDGRGVLGAEVLLDQLGEELAVELKVQLLIGDVGQLKGGAEGVVEHFAQLHLDLAVGNGGLGGFGGGVGDVSDLNEGAGGDGIVDIHQAGALLQDGPVVAGGRLQQRHGGGHQQGLGDLTLGQTQLLSQTGLPDVLLQDRHRTGDLRRGHGGTGHDLILIVTALGGALANVHAPDRPDVAAGGGDLRLHGERAVAAPGAEITHLLEVGLGGGGHTLGDDDGAFDVVHIVGLLPFTGAQEPEAVVLQDGDGGSGVGIAGQVHVDDAGRVVGHDGGNSAVGDSRIGLHIEGGAAAPCNRYLALQDLGAEGAELSLFVAVAAAVLVGQEHDVGIGAGDGADGLIAVALSLREGDLRAVLQLHGDTQHVHGIVHGSHGQGVVVGSGRAAGLEVHVIGVQAVGAGGVIGPAVVVAGGVGPHQAILGQLVQRRGIGGVGGKAGHGGTQRQVHRVAAQGHGVLNGDHVVRVVSAAALAEDLHDQQLGIGGFALGLDSLESGLELAVNRDVLVGRGDTGNVRAVLALGVIGMGHVQVTVNVVHRVGDLGVQVDAVGAADELGGVQVAPDSGHVFSGHQLDGGLAALVQLVDGILESSRVEGQVLHVKTGVDHRDLAAGAGVAQVPGLGRAGHLGGDDVLHLILRGEVLQLDHHIADTGDVLDVLDPAVGHVGGDDVGRQGDVPDHVQLGAVQSLGGDPVGHGVLFGLQAGAERSGSGGGKARVDGGRTVQDDGYADDVFVSVQRVFLLQRQFIGEGETLGDDVVIDLLKRQLGNVAGRFRFGRFRFGDGCGAEGKDHRDREQQGQEVFPGPSHASFLLD